MRVVFLGTGGSWPTKHRNVMSIALQFGSETILFDCGEGTQRQMTHTNISFMRIKRIFITHFHADHFLGIPGLLQTMNLNDREEELHIYGPPGTIELVKKLLSLGYFRPSFEVYAHDLGTEDVVRGKGYSVIPVKACHNVPAYGYTFQEDERPGRFDKPKALQLGIPEGPLFGKLQRGESVEVNGKTFTPDMVLGPPRKGLKIVYSGDTAPCESIAKAAESADLLIHEATMDEEMKEKARKYGHSTAKDAAEIARSAGVSRLALVHTSPRYESGSKILSQAKELFEGTIVPDDFMELELKHSD